MPDVKTPCLQEILTKKQLGLSQIVRQHRSICCSCHWCISHPLQTVKAHVCKVMVLHRAILLGPNMLYLHLIPRHCTTHDVDPVPGFHILYFIIVSLVVHAIEEAPPLAEYSKLTWSICRIVSMARFASEAELKAFLGKLDTDYTEYASALWHEGIKTPRQLANFTEPHYLSCHVRRGHIDDIKARADTTGIC